MPNSQNTEKEFIDKLTQLVEENISNEHFGVSELAKEMGMSRSNLHRKVNAITKISVSQYIRFARLQSSKELLLKTSDTVSEVAYKVGFSSPSYFIKCFHDYYGFPPGKVSEQEVDENDAIQQSEKSIAVLPFKSLSTDPEKQYLADGVMDAILLHLSKINDLRVISRTSVEQYRDTDKTINNICEELEVSYLLEGSFQKYGDEARLIAQLIQPGKESHIWANEYDRNWKDIFKVQSEVAQTVASELHAVITPKEKELIDKIQTPNMLAYDEYLKARSFVTDSRKESMFKAVDYLNSAIEKEPNWAPLYAGLAELWMWIQQAGYESPSVAGPKMFENLNKALELDPELAVIHYLSAMNAQFGEWNLEKSEKEFLKNLAINPNDSWSRLLYSQLLLILQRKDEALAQRKLAAGLDPFNPSTQLLYSGTLVQAGDFKAAITIAEELVAANPIDMSANQMIEIAAYNLGEYGKVIKSVKYALPFSIEENVYEGIVRIFNESGIVAAYEELMKHLEKFTENNPVSFMDLASRYIIAKQSEKAMDWIEKGFEIHDPQMTYIAASGGHFKQLFGNPRFITICEKMNLPLPPSD